MSSLCFIFFHICVKSVSVLVLDGIVLFLIAFILLSYHGALLFEVLFFFLQHLLPLLYVVFLSYRLFSIISSNFEQACLQLLICLGLLLLLQLVFLHLINNESMPT